MPTSKRLFINTLDDLQDNFDRNLFRHHTASENILRIYGITLESIDDALSFVLYHDGFHSSYILAMKRLVTA